MSVAGLSKTDGGNTVNKRTRGLRPPWKKGESGNPSGRAPKSLMQREMEQLANDPEYVAQWVTAAKQRANQKGVAGFLQSREILDRVDGPVKQELELSGNVTLASTIAERRKRAADS